MPRDDDGYFDDFEDDLNHPEPFENDRDFQNYDAEPGNEDPYRYARRNESSGCKKWLKYGLIATVLLPLSCCGGLVVLSMFFNDLKLSNGKHLGGTAMHVQFDYEIKSENSFRQNSYDIVVETADGITRDHPLGGRFQKRGTLTFHDVGGGAMDDSKFPLKVWIEKTNIRKSRTIASNTLYISRE